MSLKESTIQKIEKIVLTEKSATAASLRKQLEVSQVLIHRHLKTLLLQKKIKKIGTAPKVFYVPITPKKASTKISSKIIDQNWLEILPNGEFLYGSAGFVHWCENRHLPVQENQKKYEILFKKKEQWKKYGLIDATEKITQSFTKNYLEKMWYIDFYSWEVFGKTLLGKLILYAKQNSDLLLMESIADKINQPLLALIQREHFSLIGVIPHSVPRKRNFLNTTLSLLSLSPTPENIFEKVFSAHAVAQKTLKSKKEREQNAEETLFLKTKIFPRKILLIDDACGSGATLNIAAKKIREISPQTKVFSIAFVGSLKGFEVIKET